MHVQDIPVDIRQAVRRGVVIPAQPLALDDRRQFDPRRQRALTRYYVDAGAGGIAVGVHSTQFEIREPRFGLFEPVLDLVSEATDEWGRKRGRALLKVAGVCGRTPQAVREAEFARGHGFHAVLLSLAAMAKAEVSDLLDHCREVAGIMPLIGFYLQPAVGGRVLPFAFWHEFAQIPNVLAIKIAPFNRYQTLDVVRGVVEAGRVDEVALYTGNDDNIVLDLLSEYRLPTPQGPVSARIVGGLLGHWSVWTKRAVEQLEAIHALVDQGAPIPQEWLRRGLEITDSNAAFFDPANGFRGCIAGIHEVLRRQGLFDGIWCLDPRQGLSSGQAAQIDRVHAAYPHLHDDAFVRKHLAEWLAD